MALIRGPGARLLPSLRSPDPVRGEANQEHKAQPEQIARPKEGVKAAGVALDYFASLAMTAFASDSLGNRIYIGV